MPIGKIVRRCASDLAWVGLVAALACAAAGIGSAGARAAELCPNEALRAESDLNPKTGLPFSTELPDCRAYEQVTPPFKDDASRGTRLEGVSSDGSHVVVVSLGNFGDATNNQTQSGAYYELSRTPTGWSEVAIDPPASQFPWDQFVGVAADFTKTLWIARSTSESLHNSDLLVRDADGVLHDLGPVSPPSSTEGPPGIGEPVNGKPNSVPGASSDLSSVLFTLQPTESRSNLWPGDTTAPQFGRVSLYEHLSSGSPEPKLVGVTNEGPLRSNSEANLIGECGTNAGGVIGGATRGLFTRGAISADGATVYFTVTGADDNGGPCVGAQPPVDELYARLNGEKTVAISQPVLPAGTHCTGPCASAAHTDATFQGASQDGSQVFFLTAQPLRNSDTDSSPDLYEAELVGKGIDARIGKLVQVSHDPTAGQAAEVQGVALVSTDGSHAYFVAKGVLTSAPNALGQEAELGQDNLYVYNASTQQLAFVAALSEADAEDWAHSAGGERQVQATPDGRFLVFASKADLTPGDTSTATQLFRYDSQTGGLVRISVGQNGFNDNGNTATLDAEIPPLGNNRLESSGLAISDDGSYVVFQSSNGLTPRALNAQVGHVTYEAEGEIRTQSYLAHNVYEYHEGNVSLLSDGNDSGAKLLESSVQLRGIAPLGGDVFFEGADPLVPQDGDTQLDIYDARIGGGFPAPTLTPCLGEACQGAVTAPPLLGAPSSSAVSGPGNLTPPVSTPPAKPKPKLVKCKRGFVKRHNKCVRKKKSKKRAKKSKKASHNRRVTS
jgi:hypothetical protein